MSFERAQHIADAVLLEGYVLYPYRASSLKNRYRWTFGVIAPTRSDGAPGPDPSRARVQCLVRGQAPRLRARLRFLQIEQRAVYAWAGGSFSACERLEVDGESLLPWQEGRLHELDFALTPQAASGRASFAFECAGDMQRQEVRDRGGQLAGQIERSSATLRGRFELELEPVAGWPAQLQRLSLSIDNLARCEAAPDAPRDLQLAAALVSTHVLLAIDDGEFVSLQDPPPFAAEAARACVNRQLYPVLVGTPRQRDVLLCAPIILDDHPALAPESPGDFCDSAEIDELLMLRVLSLTPQEKASARATDPRAARIIERAERASSESLANLHGAVRARGAVERWAPGMRVRLRPGARRSDAQDLLLAGCTAAIEAVRTNVEGQTLLAVTLDDDPAAELNRWYGRFHYFYPDEVERIEQERP